MWNKKKQTVPTEKQVECVVCRHLVFERNAQAIQDYTSFDAQIVYHYCPEHKRKYARVEAVYDYENSVGGSWYFHVPLKGKRYFLTPVEVECDENGKPVKEKAV